MNPDPKYYFDGSGSLNDLMIVTAYRVSIFCIKIFHLGTLNEILEINFGNTVEAE